AAAFHSHSRFTPPAATATRSARLHQQAPELARFHKKPSLSSQRLGVRANLRLLPERQGPLSRSLPGNVTHSPAGRAESQSAKCVSSLLHNTENFHRIEWRTFRRGLLRTIPFPQSRRRFCR